jgi:hypothetical protein
MGSGISLNTFVDRAKLSESGDMRMSRDGGDLVNKGTLGQKIASLFTSIGQALGLVKETRGNEASVRQETALGSFRAALQREFGAHVANDATRHLPTGSRLTGRVVLETVRQASEQARSVDRHNATVSSSEYLKAVASRLGVDSNAVRGDTYSTYVDHFEKLKDKALEGNPRKLEDTELQGMAEDALRKALGRPSVLEEKALASNFVKERLGDMEQALKGNYHANGGKDFESLMGKVRAQVQDAASAILSPLGTMGRDTLRIVAPQQRGEMEQIFQSSGKLDAGARDKALQAFGDIIVSLNRFRQSEKV